MEQPCAPYPYPIVYTSSFPLNGLFQQVVSSKVLAQIIVTRRKCGADLGYVYTEVVMDLVLVIQQTSNKTFIPTIDRLLPLAVYSPC